MALSKSTVKRVDPMSLGKVLAVIYGVIALIIAVIYLFIIVIIGAAAGAASNNLALGLIGGLFGGILIGALIVLMYAGIGFLAGLITAAIYNVVAKRVGGVQIELETT